jgi:hypothetical protein
LSTTFALWHRADISPAARSFVAMLTGAAGREKLKAEGFR